jgi:hypothetical protein
MMSEQAVAGRSRVRRGAALLLLAWLAGSTAALGCKAPREEAARSVEAGVEAGAVEAGAVAAGAVAALDARHEPLRADFERDTAHPRLLVLASPT